MRILAVALIVTVLTACGSGKKPDEQAFLKSLDSAKTQGPSIDEEVINSILQQIPSPLEISVPLVNDWLHGLTVSNFFSSTTPRTHFRLNAFRFARSNAA